MSKLIALIVLLAGCFSAVLGQTPTASAIDQPTLYILFLTQHARDASRRAAGQGGASNADIASRFHVKPAEVPAIDAAAAQFVAQDTALTQEAWQTHLAAKSAGADLSLDAVHAFTARRAGLAIAAFTNLQSQLTPASYAGLQAYLQSLFSQSIKAVNPAK